MATIYQAFTTITIDQTTGEQSAIGLHGALVIELTSGEKYVFRGGPGEDGAHSTTEVDSDTHALMQRSADTFYFLATVQCQEFGGFDTF